MGPGSGDSCAGTSAGMNWTWVFPAISEFRALVFLSIGHHSVHTGKTMSHHSSEGTLVAVPAKIFRAEFFRLTC